MYIAGVKAFKAEGKWVQRLRDSSILRVTVKQQEASVPYAEQAPGRVVNDKAREVG